MDNPPEIPFEEKLWEDMENRLDANEPTEPKPFYWLPFLLLMFIPWLGLGYFAYAYQSINQKFETLKQNTYLDKKKYDETLGALNKQERHTTVIFDTIYKTTYIEQVHNNNAIAAFDNIVHTNPTIQPTLDWASFDASLSRYQSFFDNFDYVKLVKDYTPPILGLRNKNSLSPTAQEAMKEDNTQLIYEDDDLQNVASLSLSPLDIEEPSLYLNRPFIEQQKRRKRVSDYLYQPLRPQSFSLSLLGGTSHSLNIEGSEGNLNGKLNAAIGYGSNFELLVGLEYLSNYFDFYLDDDEQENTSQFSPPDPQNPGDLLNEIYGDFKYIQIPFGFRYYFAPKSKLQPYLGIGLVAHKPIRSSLTYEYLSIMEEYYISDDAVLAPSFVLTDMWSSIGVRYHLNSNWAALLQVSTQLELKKQPYFYQDHQYLKWNAGVEYRF